MTDCYCVCHSSFSSRPSCAHCNGEYFEWRAANPSLEQSTVPDDSLQRLWLRETGRDPLTYGKDIIDPYQTGHQSGG